jgi:hypothetical protein
MGLKERIDAAILSVHSLGESARSARADLESLNNVTIAPNFIMPGGSKDGGSSPATPASPFISGPGRPASRVSGGADGGGGAGSAATGRNEQGFFLGPPPVPEMCEPIYDRPLIIGNRDLTAQSVPVRIGWACKLSIDPPQAAGVYIDPEQAAAFEKARSRGRVSAKTEGGSGSSGRNRLGVSRDPNAITGGGFVDIDEYARSGRGGKSLDEAAVQTANSAKSIADSVEQVSKSAKDIARDNASIQRSMRDTARVIEDTARLARTATGVGDEIFNMNRARLGE